MNAKRGEIDATYKMQSIYSRALQVLMCSLSITCFWHYYHYLRKFALQLCFCNASELYIRMTEEQDDCDADQQDDNKMCDVQDEE